MIVAQLWEYIKNHLTIHFKRVSFVVEMIIWLFILHPVNVAYVDPFMHPRDKFNVTMIYESLCCWIQLASILLSIFCISVYQRCWTVTFFLWCLYLALMSGWCWPHKESLVFASLLFFETIWEWLAVILSYNIEYNSSVKPQVLDFSLLGDIWLLI